MLKPLLRLHRAALPPSSFVTPDPGLLMPVPAAPARPAVGRSASGFPCVPSRHCDLGHSERDAAAMADHLGADLDRLSPQARLGTRLRVRGPTKTNPLRGLGRPVENRLSNPSRQLRVLNHNRDDRYSEHRLKISQIVKNVFQNGAYITCIFGDPARCGPDDDLGLEAEGEVRESRDHTPPSGLRTIAPLLLRKAVRRSYRERRAYFFLAAR